MQTTLVALAVITVSYVLAYLLVGCSGPRAPRDRPTAAEGVTRELFWRSFVRGYLSDRAGRGRVDRPPGIGTFSVRIGPAALAGRGQPVGEMVRPPQFNP